MILKEIKLQEIKECNGCRFHKIKSKDNPKDILNPHANLRRYVIRNHNECVTGREWCVKFKKFLKRLNGVETERDSICVKKYALFDMPKKYRVE